MLQADEELDLLSVLQTLTQDFQWASYCQDFTAKKTLHGWRHGLHPVPALADCQAKAGVEPSVAQTLDEAAPRQQR